MQNTGIYNLRRNNDVSNERNGVHRNTISERIRQWIDRASYSEDLPEAQKSLSESNQTFKELAKLLVEELHKESFAPPGSELCIPSEFTVFLNPELDREWPAPKRLALEKALDQVLVEAIEELAKSSHMQSTAPTVELRVDGSLSRHQVRIKANWDSSLHESTLLTIPNNQECVKTTSGPLHDSEVTHVYAETEDPDGELTELVLEDQMVYRLEVWCGSNLEGVVPVTKANLRLGRGSKTTPVDVRLRDTNVSRLHAIIEYEDERYWITSIGKNGTLVGGRKLSRDQRTPLDSREAVMICSYTLRVLKNADQSSES